VGLNNLIDDGQRQACADMILMLEWLKDAKSLLLRKRVSGIGDADFPAIVVVPHLL